MDVDRRKGEVTVFVSEYLHWVPEWILMIVLGLLVYLAIKWVGGDVLALGRWLWAGRPKIITIADRFEAMEERAIVREDAAEKRTVEREKMIARDLGAAVGDEIGMMTLQLEKTERRMTQLAEQVSGDVVPRLANAEQGIVEAHDTAKSARHAAITGKFLSQHPADNGM